MSKMKKWGIGIGIFVVLGVIGSFLPESEVEDKPVPVSKEESNTVVDVSDLNLKDENYIKAIKSVNKDINTVEINENMVSIYFKEDMGVWDEKSLVKDMAIDGAKIFEKVFENKNANEATLIFKTNFTDAYGKENLNDAINITWSRETSDKVNYDNYENILYQDYTKFYMISDKFSIHPGIANELDPEEKSSMGL